MVQAVVVFGKINPPDVFFLSSFVNIFLALKMRVGLSKIKIKDKIQIQCKQIFILWYRRVLLQNFVSLQNFDLGGNPSFVGLAKNSSRQS